MVYVLFASLALASGEPEKQNSPWFKRTDNQAEGRKNRRWRQRAEPNGPIRFERTKIAPIDDFFLGAQGIENVLYTTSRNLNAAQDSLYAALDLSPDSNLQQVQEGLKNIGVGVAIQKDQTGKKTFIVESQLSPQKQALLQQALIDLFVLCKDLVQQVPELMEDVRRLNRAVQGIREDFLAEIKVSVLTGEISPFQAVKSIGIVRRNIKQVPQMLISAVLLTRELKETVQFFRFLFAGNDDLLEDLTPPKKDPVATAARINDSCDCEPSSPVRQETPDPDRANDSVTPEPQPSGRKSWLAVPEKHQDKFYDGFGGVGIGVQQYKNFALDNGGTKLLDGRETLNNEVIRGTVVSSFYYTRLRQSRVYIGYTISAMFSDSVFYSKNPRVLMNPYCPSYYDGVSSVNGGAPGGDQNMFRATEGVYTWEGEEYLYSCQEHFGVRVNRETLAHVPVEVNTAYVFRPTQKIMLWVGGGISISWYDYKYAFNQSGYASHYDSYYQEEGQSVADATYDMYWSYSYEERFGASKTLEEDGWSGLKNSYLLGTQATIGAEYIFGELPRIGGEWGLGALAKYSYIRGPVQPYEPYGGMDYEITGDDKGYYWDVDEGSVVPLLSNWNIGGTLVWHY